MGLLYYEDLKRFRVGLMSQFVRYRAIAEAELAENPYGTESGRVAAVASNLAYALAAVLGVANAEFEPEVADRLGRLAEQVLINGDFAGHNLDVSPARQ